GAGDGAAAGHRLEHRLPEALVDRGEDERGRTAVERDELVERDEAAHVDAVRRASAVAAAGEHEAELGAFSAQARERVEEARVVLVRPRPRRVEEERLALLAGR